jgi:hypothetical protein
LHLDFWGSNNEAVGKSNMYEFMIGQEFLRIKQLILSGMPTYWEINLLCCSCIHWVVFFLAIIALFIDKRKIKYVFLRFIVALMLSWGKISLF